MQRSVRAVRRSLAGHFEDELRFLRGWIETPRAVGAILPTSAAVSRLMASVIDTASGRPVLELGAGTGVITKAILARGIAPQKLHLVEYSADFATHLRRSFPRVNVIEGDAFALDATLGEDRDLIFDAVISGVPLLNFPVVQRIAYVEDLLDRLPPGRPVVQFTYGPFSPVPAGGGDYTVEHLGFVLRNMPPAQLWIYRRNAAG
ncbi:phospholipid N-methyltransferase PmtA [Aquibium sp. ELW1220]|jgi:phosphatidylethanolamine/phosphatidyl-N-methylethanolamine N-methyltransferase|uniref:phospholipid N-methyltransferase PmtA n=1 Tax=Aquibium sp. ELW1220 TaxID=2976766 RepID=UPI0025B09AEB|nr:class I SAM-dependent methyltransferase [Aquibium sp. ELW1220]MDN2578438.1 class I SAM-dependent methyltransferase [Aquibium sp. ELW1220]